MAHTPITTVPFVDLRPVNASVADVVLDDISAIVAESGYINGPAVEEFEQAFAAYCGAEFCVGVASGLDALRLTLLAWDVGESDEVIVPAQTFIATFEAVTQVGAIPVVVDVSEHDYTLDPRLLGAAISDRTRVILPVHLFGQMADMRAIRDASGPGVRILEDACQAHGAVRGGLRGGSAGDAAGFSFYPTKNLGAMGDAGAMVTDDAEVAATVRALREHGQRTKNASDAAGYTARMDTIQAAVLNRKLPELDAANRLRMAAAELYGVSLAGLGDIRVPEPAAASQPVWHVYAIRTADVEGLGRFMADRGVGSGRHYPTPPHRSRAYAELGYAEGAFPVAEALSRELLSLPLFPGITEEQQMRVVAVITEYFRDAR